MTPTAQQLAKARQSLLDLTMRNRLLNFRPSKVRSVPIVRESPAEVFEALVLREKPLLFRGTDPRRSPGVQVTRSDSTARLAGDAWHEGAERTATHVDRFLDTSLDDEALAKKLFHIYHEGHSVIEEQGYSVVHLAVAFLEWYESADATEMRRAPLILIPAELERVHAGDFSRVTWTGEEVYANTSLAAKLVEHGVDLPVFEVPEEKAGVDEWLLAVKTAIASKPRWRVTSDMVLDFFSFTKFVMFKDLDSSAWPADKKPEDHLLLRSLFSPALSTSGDDGFREEEIDRRLTARDVFHVMDADPSQIAVIEDAKAGRNLVVQGPPGTGKSQTITNLIGETLAAGKTVLFVSEKLAALEVVKSRLDAAGLDPFCVELHSRKANKKAFLEELKRSLQSACPRNPNDQVLDEHEQLKRELNQFASDLGGTIGGSGRTPYDLFADRQRAITTFAAAGRDVPSIPTIPSAERIVDQDVATAERALRAMAYVLPSVSPIASHAWRHSKVETLLPQDELELRDQLERVAARCNELRAAGENLRSLAGVGSINSLADVPRICRAASVVAEATGSLEPEILLSSEWNAQNPGADALIQRVEKYQRDREARQAVFVDQALEANSAAIVREFRTLSSRWLRIFNSRYRALRRELSTLCRSSLSTGEMLRELELLVELQRERDHLRRDRAGIASFGSRWQGDRSDPAELRRLAEWLVSFRCELLAEALTSRSIEVATSGVDRAAVRAAIDTAMGTVQRLSTGLKQFAERVRLNLEAMLGDVDSLPLAQLETNMTLWIEQLPSLFRWAQFNAARSDLRKTIASVLEPLIAEGVLNENDLQPSFRLALDDSLLRLAFVQRPALARFAGDQHEKKIERFQQLDRDLVTLNRARLSRRLHQARPAVAGGAAASSEPGILLGEFNRKRKHLAIRQLLIRAGNLIQKIKPCFLMSPLSVAQFLDAKSINFDLIVFDEASQVRPEDALGALLRGKQLVVMGDSQQLPPTSFFDHLVDDDEENDDADEPSAGVSDVESILHQCARSYPSKTLNWHYRSRHESLIAVSNYHFYENRLRIYPSAVDKHEELGLHFVHLPETIYDRGKSSTNRAEAKAVAEAAVRHYRTWGDRRSLGVGTFNIKQQQTIQEEIEVQLRANPNLEPYFKSDRAEHFFVKNLETIQGDERDVILISVGYGRDATGRLSVNFGPVNREGGERRLNVLMSRARLKCVVFSNFTSRDLSLESTSARGVFALKSFLEYAETRRLTTEERPLEDSDSPFEDAVADVLTAHGHEVRKQVGCAGFRVDLAIVDPSNRGSYLLGIECDGAKYHSSPVARDRDRLRQQILEGLGWRIYRVWSTDWYRNQRDTIDRLLRAVERASTAPPPQERPVSQQSQAPVSPPTISSYLVSDVDRAGEPFFTRPWIDDIPLYETCHRISNRNYDEYNAEAMARSAEEVVRVEGPIHFEELVKRLRTLYGFDRAGNRIRNAVGRGVAVAVSKQSLQWDGDFVREPRAAVRLRRRDGNPPPKIELICDEEISLAVKKAIEVQFSLSREDAAVQASRALGVKATSDATLASIARVIDKMLERGDLGLDGGLLRGR